MTGQTTHLHGDLQGLSLATQASGDLRFALAWASHMFLNVVTMATPEAYSAVLIQTAALLQVEID
jgi:hypothetical protein